ncbi:hypothetical protein [Frankia sp. Cppng1_Ct_nod]|uniref:DUF6928 family protein n=1 Tax=Frankia sp. Cppng1_Ct_nod TaxID=2897162 RepID=UPI001041335E|nr:hypothetical protein [Frankia sp. Cppng1_Ct_nod]
MGARTSLVMFCSDEVGRVPVGREPDEEATRRLLSRLFPGERLDVIGRGTLEDHVNPASGLAYAGSFGDVDIVTCARLSVDLPSKLGPVVAAAGTGRQCHAHAMSSVAGWLGFGVWADTRLVRALSVNDDDGILESFGEPLGFEGPFWAGERSSEDDSDDWDDESDDPDTLPFDALEMGEEALRSLFGFVVEGIPMDDDINPQNVPLLGFRFW